MEEKNHGGKVKSGLVKPWVGMGNEAEFTIIFSHGFET